jgi:pimeloyl-ACP methyl ester carboxylesterase
MTTTRYLTSLLLALSFSLFTHLANAACVDTVVLVHGNTATPSSWDNTYNLLLNNGYRPDQIIRPDWGSKTCAACNNHSGSEQTPVRNAIINGINNSCTGKIDVVAHSMGSTLAAQQISQLAAASFVDTFVSIAGAFRGLRSCGTFPFNIPTPTCGSAGLSINSPLLDSLFGEPLADNVYSIKSFIDQIVCSTGICTVGGVHSSQIAGENDSLTFFLGHFGLQTDTAQTQFNLIR